jgi:multiple sugar transport system substrate-binding protein
VAYLHAYDDDPIWKQEPRLGPYKEQVASAHLPGWPAAPGRAASESLAKYVIVDMFAKAAQGQPTKSVISDAAAQIKQIYNIS